MTSTTTSSMLATAALKTLLDMGFEASPAQFALEQTKGDVDAAVAMLGEAGVEEEQTLVATNTTTTTPTPPPRPAPSVLYHSRDSTESGFLVITNDDSERNAIWLVALREIYSKQLPKMPKEYIAKLVMDKNHQSLMVFDKELVVGGITFRPYVNLGFSEIAFCAVSANEQVKGYGSRMMNQLKEYSRTRGLLYFLTFADNHAIGYFKKQGFSSHLSLPRERWQDVIKDYEGGTLMECVVHPRINYLQTKALVKQQREFLLEKMRDVGNVVPIYPGLDKLMENKIDNPWEEISGIKAAGWRKPLLPTLAAAAAAMNERTSRYIAPLVPSPHQQTPMYIVSRRIVDRLFSCKDSWPFREPVPPAFSDYYDVIAEPIDLTLVRARLDEGTYETLADLRRDVDLMLLNCTTYNAADTTYHRAALVLVALSASLFADAEAKLSGKEVEAPALTDPASPVPAARSTKSHRKRARLTMG